MEICREVINVGLGGTFIIILSRLKNGADREHSAIERVDQEVWDQC